MGGVIQCLHQDNPSTKPELHVSGDFLTRPGDICHKNLDHSSTNFYNVSVVKQFLKASFINESPTCPGMVQRLRRTPMMRNLKIVCKGGGFFFFPLVVEVFEISPSMALQLKNIF